MLYVLGQAELARCRFPVGTMTKAEVRAKAAALGLATAAKPDSQDVCFVTTSGGREALLASRIPLHPNRRSAFLSPAWRRGAPRTPDR